MISDDTRAELRTSIRERVKQDSKLLNELRESIRPLKGKVTTIQARPAHSVAVVATDGGNNKFQFDPFLIQVIRVVDSSNNSHALDVVSPATVPNALLAKHIDAAGNPLSPLGKMMKKLEVTTLHELSSMIPETINPDQPNTSWVSAFRELQEWAALLELASELKWGSDTVLILDGLLRTKKFAGTLFARYRDLLEGALKRQKKDNGRNIYVVGFSKENQVLTRYRLAMSLEGILTTSFPAYLEIPREIELKTYKWKEWAKGDDVVNPGEEENKFVGGKLFFAKFGNHSRDAVWPVDIIQSQIGQAQLIMGCLLNDTLNGFPILNYPRSLQIAHENAAMAGFDMELLKHEVFESVRESLGAAGHVLDGFRLQDQNPSSKRYK